MPVFVVAFVLVFVPLAAAAVDVFLFVTAVVAVFVVAFRRQYIIVIFLVLVSL